MQKKIQPQIICTPEQNDQEYPITLLEGLREAPKDCILAFQDSQMGNSIYILQSYRMGDEYIHVNVWVNAMDPTDYRPAECYVVDAIRSISLNSDGPDVYRFNNLADCLEYLVPATEAEQIPQKVQPHVKTNLHVAIGKILQQSVQINGMQKHINDVREQIDEAIDILWLDWGFNSDEHPDETHIQDRMYWEFINQIDKRLGIVLRARKVSSLVEEIFNNQEIQDIWAEVHSTAITEVLAHRFGNVNTERFAE